MTTVISQGTGRRAALGPGQFAAGKTGTTENSGDAWFVGFTKRWTVAVWVGYPDKLKPMLTEFAGAAGRGRHLPGADLARLHGRGQRDRRRPQRQGRASARGLPPKPPADQTTTTTPAPVIPTKPAPVPEGGASAPAAPQTPTAPAGGTSTRPATGTGGRGRTSTGTDDPAAGPDHHAAAAGAGDRRHRRHRRRRPARRRHRRAAVDGRRGAARARAPAATAATRGGCRARRSASQVDGLRDPDALADVERRRLPAGGARLDADRPVEQRGAVELEADAERLRELARAVAQLLVARDAPARAHDLDAVERLAARG